MTGVGSEPAESKERRLETRYHRVESSHELFEFLTCVVHAQPPVKTPSVRYRRNVMIDLRDALSGEAGR